jgi:hypothetical protein
MAPKRGKRTSVKKKNISFQVTTSTTDSEDASSSKSKKIKEKSKKEIEHEQENEIRKQKIREQHLHDKKHPDAVKERDQKIIGEYIKKKARGKEFIMSIEDIKKIQYQLWSPQWHYLTELMKQFGWHNTYDPKREYSGYLWIKKTTKKEKKS